jgi:hypothetical protein
MSADHEYLLRVLADVDDVKTANKLASAICKLIVDGAELGGLIAREVTDQGAVRTSLTLPDEWITRLANAVDRGAFEAMSVKKIVERILLPPLPAEAAE